MATGMYEGEMLEVYTINGMLAGRAHADASGCAQINVSNGIYVAHAHGHAKLLNI